MDSDEELHDGSAAAAEVGLEQLENSEDSDQSSESFFAESESDNEETIAQAELEKDDDGDDEVDELEALGADAVM